MWECGCGFANNDSAAVCAACGAQAPSRGERAGSLVLVNLRTKQRIEVTRPGGIIGRAGDFCPESFSPRVSRVHLVAEAHENGTWTLEFVGRHKTEIDAAGVWAPLEPDMPREVMGGEKLRMADMLFRIEVVPGAPATPPAATAYAPREANSSLNASRRFANEAADDTEAREAVTDPEYPAEPWEDESYEPDAAAADSCGEGHHADDAPNPGEESDAPRQIGWVVRCPVCGAAYPVDEPDDRIDACPACFDPLDAASISRCAPQPLYE